MNIRAGQTIYCASNVMGSKLRVLRRRMLDADTAEMEVADDRGRVETVVYYTGSINGRRVNALTLRLTPYGKTFSNPIRFPSVWFQRPYLTRRAFLRSEKQRKRETAARIQAMYDAMGTGIPGFRAQVTPDGDGHRVAYIPKHELAAKEEWVPLGTALIIESNIPALRSGTVVTLSAKSNKGRSMIQELAGKYPNATIDYQDQFDYEAPPSDPCSYVRFLDHDLPRSSLKQRQFFDNGAPLDYPPVEEKRQTVEVTALGQSVRKFLLR